MNHMRIPVVVLTAYISSRIIYILLSCMRGADKGAPSRQRDSSWRSKSLTIGQSVKVLVQCVIVLV